MIGFELPENFLMGTATSSAQIEGGDTNNTWYRWCVEGHVKDGSNCIVANDHWNRIEGDIEILKQLNVDTHRMSLEWSRIEPEKGKYFREAIEHYRNEISLLLKNNIKPLVTLHHFSEPLWFHEMGSWKKAENTAFFLEYVRYVIEELGDLVTDWITFNEPNVYSFMGHVIGFWPPGERKLRKAFKVQKSMVGAHIEAYRLIHDIREKKEFPGKTMVGAAIHIMIFEGVSFAGKMVARLADYLFNDLLMEATVTGKMRFPLWGKDYSYPQGKYVDFIGINYYTRNLLRFTFQPDTFFIKLDTDKKLDKNDLGWDIYPKGLYDSCKKYYSKYRLPIYITENGISDSQDKKRAEYICSHLLNISEAIHEGIPVQRYYYWTLMDNFEWIEGERAFFGLVECNFKNQERTMRRSVKLFGEICKKKKLIPEDIKRYQKESEAQGKVSRASSST